MTVDFSKPVQTRDGRKARILCTDADNPDGSVVALVEYAKGHPHEGKEACVNYYPDGSYVRGYCYTSASDLVNVPERSSEFSNILYNGVSGVSMPSVASCRSYRNQGATYAGVLETVFEDGVVVDMIYHKDA